ncbi:hypothetical protein GBAR_LOCUS947 [Geodia barretti]|uniref:Uncharacterized protein n=1 Tax=Geodia barretti TaxID=519541 RepID=A0AA35QV23_GEOBA|nr:hypothetical protein GBAR_LOCUS947 [Geodia barretti]
MVSFLGRTDIREVRCRVTDTHTHTHTHTHTQLQYPRCACAPRVIRCVYTKLRFVPQHLIVREATLRVEAHAIQTTTYRQAGSPITT